MPSFNELVERGNYVGRVRLGHVFHYGQCFLVVSYKDPERVGYLSDWHIQMYFTI